MDKGQFDALARSVFATTSRRAAFAVMLGALLPGIASDTLLAKPKRKGKRKRKNNGKGRGKRKDRNKRRKKRNQQDDPPCYSGASCYPGQGRDNSECDFTSSMQFFEGDFNGSNFSNANFTGAQLAGANFRGADLEGTCLVGANLLGATIDASTNLDGAIFCRTIMPDGSINDHDCGKGTRCCPTPGRICPTCAGFDCIATPDTVCSIFGTPCCPGMLCAATPVGFLTSCQAPCDTDQECVAQFGPGLKCCSQQTLLCPFLPGARCCQPPGEFTC